MIDLNAYADFCEWAPTSWLVLSENVFDPLIYYSHLVPVLLSLPLAALVFYQAPKQRLNQLFLLLVLLFSLWSFCDLILWAHSDPGTIMTFWSFLILIEPLIYITALLFAYTALFKRPVGLALTLAMSALLLPTVLLLPTNMAIVSFNLTNCWREVTEGPLVYYGYIIQLMIAATIATMTVYYFVKTVDRPSDRYRAALTTVGVLLFLGVFSSGNIVGSWFEDWTLGQYGIFGMPILVAFIAFLIARYRIFDSKILGAEILIGTLGVLTLGILFIPNLQTVRYVSVVTFVLVMILGIILIHSIRREAYQLKEIEKLAQRLEKANKRLRVLDNMKSEFVSIASHQLRSPLTSIRGYTSMLLEGSYGKLSQKTEEVIQHIADSSRLMALSVEDYLNVSRIESGNMRYENSDFTVKVLAETVADELRPIAMKRGLLVTFKSNINSQGIVRADIGKTKQVIQNLVDNALKYTEKGSIKVFVHDDSKKKQIFVDVIDTGIGMSNETLINIFGKFERAQNANAVNVTGTGLGLYVARNIARAMGGDVVATSEGEGKGSTFTLVLPLLK